MSIENKIAEAFANFEGTPFGFVNESTIPNKKDTVAVVIENVKKEGIEMSLIEKINAGMANAMITVEGQDFVTKTPNMPQLAGDYRGFDSDEATVRNNGFIKGGAKGKAWYENHTTHASVPNNIPMTTESVPVVSSGFNTADLSKVTSDVVNNSIGLYGVKNGVSLRFLPPYENDAKMFAVVEVNLPIVFGQGDDAEYVYTKSGSLAYSTHLFPVYDSRNGNGELRPFIMGLMKSSQRYLGKIQAVDKNGVGITYKNSQGTDMPSMVSHYADTMYQSVSLPYSSVEILAQIHSFVKERVEARINIILGR